MSRAGIVGYATYLPHHRLSLAELSEALGSAAGKGSRIVASFDEDSTTLAVAAAQALMRPVAGAPGVGATGRSAPEPPGRGAALYFATTSAAYADKTNATAIHAALGLPPECFAADLAGAARSGVAALRAAAASGGLAVLADVRNGRPGSADERGGGDGAAAFRFGEPQDAIAVVEAEVSATAEFLDRWRSPGEPAARQWEERFGLEAYRPLITDGAARALKAAGLAEADHVALVSPNYAVARSAGKLVPGRLSTTTSPIGHAGAADAGLALAAALDRAQPGETILLLSAADGCDALLLRATERIAGGRQATPVAVQLAGGVAVPYPSYLTWRGWLEREAPRRPEPEAPAAPPSARAAAWKYGFAGSVCRGCGFTHLPPVRVCKSCGAVDEMDHRSLAGAEGTVATYTVDRLAYSPSPPLIEAVIDLDGGGRCTLEVADATPEQLAVGVRVGLTFRRLHTAAGVHNYFWKARVLGREAG